jgi:hypothetical protein
MDSTVLKKRLSTFKTKKGTLSRVSDELTIDVLRSWESWSGTSKEFYQNLGVSKQQLGGLIRKGKQLVKSGIITESEFSEIKVESTETKEVINCRDKIVLKWKNNNIIHFAQVDQLIDFLKKVA